MRLYITITLGILWGTVLVCSCKSQKTSPQSIPVYGEEGERTFDGIPSKVVKAVALNMRAMMEESPEDYIPRTFAHLDRHDLHIGIPYEIYLIKADTLENGEPPGFDGLQLSTYYVPVTDTSGVEYVTLYARQKGDDEVYSSGYQRGGMYGYTAFLHSQNCRKTSRRIVIRRVPRSGYPRAFKFVGCLGPDQTLESGRYWAINDIGNRLDKLDKREYQWREVFERMVTYYKKLKSSKGAKKWR